MLPMKGKARLLFTVLLVSYWSCGPASVDSAYELRDLTYDQWIEFKQDLDMARLFLEEYGVKGTEAPFDAKNLDLALATWRADDYELKESAEEVIDCLGVAFGQDLISTMDCQWKILSDVYGEDFTAIHQKYELTIFPFSSAYKMIEEPDSSRTFQAIKEFMSEMVREAKATGEFQERRDK